MAEYEEVPGGLNCGDYTCRICYREKPTAKPRAPRARKPKPVVKETTFADLMALGHVTVETPTVYESDDNIVYDMTETAERVWEVQEQRRHK